MWLQFGGFDSEVKKTLSALDYTLYNRVIVASWSILQIFLDIYAFLVVSEA